MHSFQQWSNIFESNTCIHSEKALLEQCKSKHVSISTPDKGPVLLKGHISGEKGVASQEGFTL